MRHYCDMCAYNKHQHHHHHYNHHYEPQETIGLSKVLKRAGDDFEI